MLRQLLKPAVALNGILEIGDLFPGNIPRNIPTAFIALMDVIGALGALADNADAPSVHPLNLSDVLKD